MRSVDQRTAPAVGFGRRVGRGLLGLLGLGLIVGLALGLSALFAAQRQPVAGGAASPAPSTTSSAMPRPSPSR